MTFNCPECGEENEINDDDESAVCEECDAILLLDVSQDGTISVTVP